MKIKDIEGVLGEYRQNTSLDEAFDKGWNGGYNTARTEIGEREVVLDVEKTEVLVRDNVKHDKLCYCEIDEENLAQAIAEACPIKVKK